MYSNLPLPESSGWLHNTNRTYAIEWEDPEILKLKIELEGQWSSSSRVTPTRKDAAAISSGATRREATVALGRSAKGVRPYLCSSQ